MALLQVNDLKMYFRTRQGTAKAVDGVSFSVDKGEVLGIVGESGCGKSVTSLSIMRLLDKAAAIHAGGEILLDGQNLLGLSQREMNKIRGKRISMIFQEPMSSLNPVLTVEWQLVEAIRLHMSVSRAEAKEKAVSLLEQVGIPDPARRIREFPFQMSGGMRQRVMIAMAIACEPELLIADEPTTALDVTIQAQILELLKEEQKKRNLAIIFITHDLGVISGIADKIAVMYAGEVIEEAPSAELFRNPCHPYTKGLIRSIPDGSSNGRLYSMEGMVPSLLDMPAGCKFAPRCPYAEERCRAQHPDLIQTGEKHIVRCWRENHE